MSNCPPTPIALFNLHCKHVNFWHAHQLLYFYVHTLSSLACPYYSIAHGPQCMHAFRQQNYYCLRIAWKCSTFLIQGAKDSGRVSGALFWWVHRNIMHRWNRSTVEHTDISCISSLLASIKSSRACIMEFPSSGSHLHLVIVSDKSSRGEVADLIARILTRWRVDRDYDQGSQVGGNGSHLETRVEVAEKKGVAYHSFFTCQHWADY